MGASERRTRSQVSYESEYRITVSGVLLVSSCIPAPSPPFAFTALFSPISPPSLSLLAVFLLWKGDNFVNKKTTYIH
jgi:hypothetical protein